MTYCTLDIIHFNQPRETGSQAFAVDSLQYITSIHQTKQRKMANMYWQPLDMAIICFEYIERTT